MQGLTVWYVQEGQKNNGGFMFDKLEDLLRRFEEIQNELSEPSVVSDQNRFRKLMKEQNDLTPIVEAFQEYKKEKQNIDKFSVRIIKCTINGLLKYYTKDLAMKNFRRI